MNTLQLFYELHRHGKLAGKRHPMYDTNRFAKIASQIGAVFAAAYMIFIATMLALGLEDESREAYHIIGGGFVFFMILDFIVRFPFQTTPTQEIKPYLLMPVKRNRVIDFLLVRSGMSSFNLIWEFFFVPFALLTVMKFYGLFGVLLYCIGVWLLMLFNNYWFLLCKTLIGECVLWCLLPIAVYGGIIAWIFIPDESPVFDCFMLLFDGFVKGNILAFLIALLPTLVMFAINRKLMVKLFYKEVNKVEDTKVRASDYNFFERYGEIGEYMRLELKMLLRNKACKNQMRMISIVVIVFNLQLSFTEAYDGGMSTFILIYNFAIFGMMYLINIMAYEGNYIDGLMSRKESIYTLLRAKYIFYLLAELIPFILMLPAVIMCKLSLLSVVAMMLFTAGPVYCGLFQLAVYNKKTVPLNVKLASRMNMGSGMQNLLSMITFLPLPLYPGLRFLVGQTAADAIFVVIGIAFIVTNKYWLRSVYRRFMSRRYDNMAGFRDSRVKN